MRDTKQEIIDFWFIETKPQQWFQVNPDFDALLRGRFMADYQNAAGGAFAVWRNDADGCLALCLLLDQFPRNMFRDTPAAFATDAAALEIAAHAIARGFDLLLPPIKRRFLYLPYEHSESIDDQDKSVALFSSMKKDDPLGYEYAVKHREVIREFGRFPHRNIVLGRANTARENEYLAKPGAGF